MDKNSFLLTRRGFNLRETFRHTLAYLPSSPHIQAAVGPPDKGPLTLLNSRIGERHVHSGVVCDTAWNTGFRDEGKVFREKIAPVLRVGEGRFTEDASSAVNHIQSSHAHLHWHKQHKMGHYCHFPVNQNIYMCVHMFICVHVCAYIHAERNCWGFLILFFKLLRHCDKFTRRKILDN